MHTSQVLSYHSVQRLELTEVKRHVLDSGTPFWARDLLVTVRPAAGQGLPPLITFTISLYTHDEGHLELCLEGTK